MPTLEELRAKAKGRVQVRQGLLYDEEEEQWVRPSSAYEEARARTSKNLEGFQFGGWIGSVSPAPSKPEKPVRSPEEQDVTASEVEKVRHDQFCEPSMRKAAMAKRGESPTKTEIAILDRIKQRGRTELGPWENTDPNREFGMKSILRFNGYTNRWNRRDQAAFVGLAAKGSIAILRGDPDPNGPYRKSAYSFWLVPRRSGMLF